MFALNQVNYIDFGTIDSTNTWVKKNLEDLDLNRFHCISAKEQTAGRGRFKRNWISPAGNLFCSFVFNLPKQNLPFYNLGELMTLSCASVLHRLNIPIDIKWPNDLIIHGKKLGGVLTEISIVDQGIVVIIGLGINLVISEEQLKKIDQPAISCEQLGVKPDRKKLIQLITMQFIEDLNVWLQEGFLPFHQPYEQRLAIKDKEITYDDGSHLHRGICRGITSQGKLLLELEDGAIKELLSGEVIY